MPAGRPHETASHGTPRWMTGASRKRGHRPRPTGRLTPFFRLTCGLWSQARRLGPSVVVLRVLVDDRAFLVVVAEGLTGDQHLGGPRDLRHVGVAGELESR